MIKVIEIADPTARQLFAANVGISLVSKTNIPKVMNPENWERFSRGWLKENSYMKRKKECYEAISPIELGTRPSLLLTARGEELRIDERVSLNYAPLYPLLIKSLFIKTKLFPMEAYSHG